MDNAGSGKDERRSPGGGVRPRGVGHAASALSRAMARNISGAGGVDGGGGVEVADREGEGVEFGAGDAGLEEALGVVERLELVVGRGDVGVGVALGRPAVVADGLDGKVTGPVVVEERRQHVVREVVDARRVAPGDVGVAEMAPDHGAVLALDEGVVVGAPRAGLGELLDVELVEQPGGPVVDVLRAVVCVEAHDPEGKASMSCSRTGSREGLGDGLDGADELVLGDLVDDVDQVAALFAVEVALVDGVDRRRKPGRPPGCGLRRSPMAIWTGRVLVVGVRRRRYVVVCRSR